MTAPFDLKDHGVTVAEIHRNLPPSALYEHAIRYEKDASIAENGALVAYSGVKTGRSPKDKRVVKHPDSEANVWWGTVNIPITPQTFAITGNARATISIFAIGFIVSTGLLAGIIRSKYASSALGPTMRCSCTRCS